MAKVANSIFSIRRRVTADAAVIHNGDFIRIRSTEATLGFVRRQRWGFVTGEAVEKNAESVIEKISGTSGTEISIWGLCFVFGATIQMPGSKSAE